MLRSSFAPTRLARLPLPGLRTRTSFLSPSHLLPLRMALHPLVSTHPLHTTATPRAKTPSMRKQRHPREPVVSKAWHKPPTSDRLAPNAKIEFHPLFYSTYITDMTAEEAPQELASAEEEEEGEAGFDEPEHNGLYPTDNAWEFVAIDDFATKPSSRKVRIELASEVLPLVENPDGVTVRQVFEAIVKHWLLTKRADLDFLRHVKYIDEYLDDRTEFWAFVDDDGVPRFSIYNRGMAAGTHPDDFPQPVGDGPASRLLASIPPEDKA